MHVLLLYAVVSNIETKAELKIKGLAHRLQEV